LIRNIGEVDGAAVTLNIRQQTFAGNVPIDAETHIGLGFSTMGIWSNQGSVRKIRRDDLTAATRCATMAA
jgi:hypothetical protein